MCGTMNHYVATRHGTMNLDKLRGTILILIAAAAVTIAGLAVYSTSKQTDIFIQVCKENNGIPAYNGRNWECIKS